MTDKEAKKQSNKETNNTRNSQNYISKTPTKQRAVKQTSSKTRK